MLTIQQLTEPRALHKLVPEWEALDAELAPRTPFTSPWWNIFWWDHMRSDTLTVRDQFFAHAVRDSDLRLVAVAPMMLTERPGKGPLRLRELGFFGADPNMTEIRGLVCRPADQPRVVAALSEHFIANCKDWDWIRWSGLHQDAELPDAGNGALHLKAIRDTPDYCLALPGSWDELRSALSRNTKEALRKCYNSLKRDGHAFTFRIVERPEDTSAALQRFFDLHTARARLDGTVKHRDVFEAPRARLFLADYARAMAERGCLRIFEIEVGGAVVATRIGFVFGKELYLYYTGYNPDWGKYSIMTTVVAESIKWAIENHFDVVNLSTGNDVSKLRWGPKEITFRQGVQVAPGLRSRLAFTAYSEVQSLSQNTEWGQILNKVRRNRA